MKHVKMFGLLVMAGASLMAFPSSGMATNATLTSPAGTEYTGTIEATQQAGTSLNMSAGGMGYTCTTSAFKGTVTTNTTTHAAFNISSWQFGSVATPCNKDAIVFAHGSMTVFDTGTVTLFNNELTVNDTALGVSCVYGGGTGTDLGTVTPGTPAKLSVNTTKLKKISGGFLCASEGTWTANYIITTPSTTLIT